MKKSYILIAMAALTIAVSCRRSENELPESIGRAKIKTTLVGFASSDAIQMGETEPTPQMQYAPQAAPKGKQIGVITPMGMVDTLALSKLTDSPTRAHSTEEFRAGDMIGVYVHVDAEVGQGTANHTVNTPYIIADGVEWQPVYALGGAYTEPTYHMSAYYPYNETLVNAWEIPHSVALDQSAPSSTVSGALEKSNLLIARGATVDNATTNPSASLDFVHAMSLFEVKILLPKTVEGREIDSLESIIVKGTETRATLNLATGGLTIVAGNKADIKPRRTAGNGRPGVMSVFESIVVPQSISGGATLLGISCRMADGSLEQLDYVVPESNWLSLKSGYRTSITIMPTAKTAFMGELPLLIDGLEHEDMVMPIFVASGLKWTLSVENIDWMTISNAVMGVYGKTLSGESTTGAIINIYVNVEANTSQTLPRHGDMLLQAFQKDGSEITPALYRAVQNYYNFSSSGLIWNAPAGEASTPVAPFAVNQMWRAVSTVDWLKLARSATYGQGDPATSYSHIGALSTGELFFQVDANNSAGSRQGVVSFASDLVGEASFSHTVKQEAPYITLSEKEVAVFKDAADQKNLFTVTAPAGVKWKILSVTPVGGDMGLTLNFATGVEQIGTGEAVQVKASYASNTGSVARSTDVVLAYATYGAAQQVKFRITQEVSAGPQYVIVDGLKWATGNLVANGANGAKVGAPEDGGLYFQFGSLIGWKGGASGDGTGRPVKADNSFYSGGSFNAANEVQVVPNVFTKITNIGATWPDQLGNNTYYFGHNAAPYETDGTNIQDYSGFSSGSMASDGVGDPCRYYLGGTWRLPTSAEFQAMHDAASITREGTWTNATSTSSYFVYTFSGVVELKFPAVGIRNYSDGAICNVGDHGFYWSSSVSNSSWGHYLNFNSNLVFPQNNDDRRYGFPVRCVQEISYEPQPPTPDQVVMMNGLRWAKGNLIAAGGPNCKVGEPGDGGLYFQYGGLIGYKGGAMGDGTGITNATTHPNGKWWNGASAYSANDIAVTPVGYTNQATYPISSSSFGYYYFNDFVTKYADFQLQSNANQPTLGIGDPCAYYLGSPWRLPTVYELSAITGSAVEGNWVPWTTAGVTGRWEKTNGPKSAIGAWFGPNSRSGTPTVNTDLFIPASGLRYYTAGQFYNVSTNSYLWSSSVYGAIHGFSVHIHEPNGVIPSLGSSRAYGFPVRCVEGIPHEPAPPTPDQIITINGLKWTKGNLVADGLHNAKVGEPGDNGLYFQYGGLIGYKGGSTGNGVGVIDATTHTENKYWNGASAYTANEIAVAPSVYTYQTTWPYYNLSPSGGHGYYYTSTFDIRYADFQSQPGADQPRLGIGDPCTYYLGSDWRLPRYYEFSSFTGAGLEGVWTAWTAENATGKWTSSGPKSSRGAWFGPNARNGKPTVNTDMFVPAAGYRQHDVGAFEGVGTYGYLWCSSNYGPQHAYNCSTNELQGVYPRAAYNRAFALPVRCVQEIPHVTNPPAPDQVITMNGLRWTTGNLIAAEGPNCKVGAPGDGGLYFQYGGLIGYKGGAKGDGRGIVNPTIHSNNKLWGGAAKYSANDVAVAPADYINQYRYPYHNAAAGGFGYYYYTSFITKYADFQSQTNADQPTLGIGDPCTYYLGSPWRLPKYNELAAITGSDSETVWVKWDVAGITGKWDANGPQSSKGAWFGPNARKGNPTVNTDLFIPASGNRSASSGEFYNVNVYSSLWSSSAHSSTYGLCMYVHSTNGMIPCYGSGRTYAFPVRCVAPEPLPDNVVEVAEVKWAKGNLVADGANNAKIGEPGDNGLYFQYGGLIGYKGGATGSGTGVVNASLDGKYWGNATAYSANDVAVAPATYTKQAAWPYFDKAESGGFGYYYFSTLASRPSDFQSQSNANQPELGIGDPCSYYLGLSWRLPKISELSAIAAASTGSNFVEWSDASITGKWVESGPKSSKGAWFGPNSRSGTPNVNSDLFIPAAGYRRPNTGAFLEIGNGAVLWSSSVYNSFNGYYLDTHTSLGVHSTNYTFRSVAMPVRCVLV